MKEFRIEGLKDFAKYGTTTIAASSYKAAFNKFIKENGIEEEFVEMTQNWIDTNLPGTYGLELIKHIDIVVKNMSIFTMPEKWYIVNKPEYKAEAVCKDYICKDANGRRLRTNSEVMVIINDQEYQGYVVETLPDNKVKISAEDRTITIDAANCYNIE